MPHDRDGRPLKVGDVVIVPCHIKTIYQTEDYCNVELETSQPMWPGTSRSTLTLNAKQVISIDPEAAAIGRLEQHKEG